MAEPPKSLVPPRLKFDENNPYNGDLFNRSKLAETLTNYIDRLRDGSVLAIDAPWGEGKTWFGLNWSADLRSKGYRVIFLDAFQQDYMEDPFLLIASEISQTVSEDQTFAQELKEKSASVMKAILPVSAKLLLSIAGRVALGNIDASKEISEAIKDSGNSATDATQKWLEDKIESYTEEKASLEAFRKSLQEFAESQEKPVVFFIDELDRCRPDFAVRLIERIKHFFDVPNLVFVLLLNREQLEKAVKGVYGQDTDAAAYLNKFIHAHLKLPKADEATADQSNFNWKYLWALSDHYKLSSGSSREPLNHFISTFSVFASIMGMSLRDLERGVAMLALYGVSESSTYMAWPVVLKLKHPKIFSGLQKDDPIAHQAAAKLLHDMDASEHYHFWAKKYFLPLHIAAYKGQEALTDEQRTDLEQYAPRGHFRQDKPLQFWLKRLDIFHID